MNPLPTTVLLALALVSPSGIDLCGAGLSGALGSGAASLLLPSAAGTAPAATAGAGASSSAQGRASGRRKKKGGKKKSPPKRPKKSPSKKSGRSLSGRSIAPGSSLPGLGPGLETAAKPLRPDLAPLTLDDLRGPSTSPSGADGGPDGSRAAQLEYVDRTQLEEWFSLADYNGTSWISFREARAALELERERFAFYDSDRDGRLRVDEFERYYADSMRLGGAFMPPKPPPGPLRPPQRTPEQLRNAYDNDLDGAISLFELGRMLIDYGRVELDAGDVLRLMDADRNEVIGVDELTALSGILHPVVPPSDVVSGEAGLAAEGPKTILDLFGAVELRGTEIGGTPYPPRIVGPVPIFRRLDLDQDGFITTIDLSELLRPIQIGFRPHAVLGTLDLDGDGRLSPAEFERAMLGGPLGN